MKIYFDDEPKEINEDDPLLKSYSLIIAAGGLVLNDEGKILMIFRRGKWDLPKGKFENGETVEECAAREVKEETGLSRIDLKRPLLTSYHTYSDRKGPVLKETYWFLFAAPGSQEVVPQYEEDIVKIEWVHPDDLANYTNNTYGLIKDVLNSAGFVTDPSTF